MRYIYFAFTLLINVMNSRMIFMSRGSKQKTDVEETTFI